MRGRTTFDQNRSNGINSTPAVKEHVNGGESHHLEPVSDFRRALPQYLAVMAKNLLLFDLGIVVGFPTIVIPALLNAKEGLSLDLNQASWIGSLVHFFHPIGSLTAAVVLDSLGRKWSMILLNIPFFCCWVALYYVETITLLFILIAVLGFSIGSIEAAVMAYIGEISEPKLRGVLTSLTQICENLGFVYIFVLGSFTNWQTSALISASVPIISVICLLQVPETPIWLISRGRMEDAMEALCWLRGWVKPELVQAEFDELVRYNTTSKMFSIIRRQTDLKNSSSPNHIHHFNGGTPGIDYEMRDHAESVKESNFPGQNQNVVNSGVDQNQFDNFNQPLPQVKVSFKDKLRDFFRRGMMLPMFLMCSFFFFTYGSGLIPMRPYMIPIFKHLGFRVDPFLATAVLSAIGLGSCTLCMLTVRTLGKRPLALISLAGCGVCAFSLCAYAYYIDQLQGPKQAWIPQTLMACYAFFTGVGMDPLPWMYLSEIFPFRGRGLACGIAAGLSNFMGFIAAKTYLYLESSLTLFGVFGLYGFFCLVGVIYFYFYLPETEGESLEDIEDIFKKNQKS